MPKTYNTIPSVTTGDVYTAAAHNNIVTNVNNYRVPPACHVYRSSDLTAYSSGTSITWNAEAIDTDGMWASGTNVVIDTAGLYLMVLKGNFTATATLTANGWRIAVDGTAVAQSYTQSVASGTLTQQSVSYVMPLTAGQIVTANITASGGSAYIIKGGASPHSENVTSLSVTWLGQVS